MTSDERAGVSGAEVNLEIVYDTTLDRMDLEQLATLFRAVGWENRANDRARMEESLRGSRWIVSAWDADRLVGFARAFTDGAYSAYVSNVAVLPSHQGRGIGRELIRRLMEGRERIAFVLHADARVQPFYRKLGYEDAPDMLRRPRKS